MPTFPYTLPVELIERIIKLSFQPAGGRTPPSPPSTSLLSVSKAVRLLALPYFFEVVIIHCKENWQTFFDPSTGIFVVGEEGATRWGWVKELVVPLEFPPPLNPHYKLGQPSYFTPLTIPNSKRIDFLRYLPIPFGTSDPHTGPEQDALIDLLADGEDPDMLAEATGDSTNFYECDESQDESSEDEEEVPWRKKGRKKGTKKISRMHREFPTLASFLASEEGLDRTKYTLFEHFAEILEVLTSDFYHSTLPTQLAPKVLFLPEKIDFISFEDLGPEPNSDLVFAPEGPRMDVATSLWITRYPQGALREEGGEATVFAFRSRWKTIDPTVLDGFGEDWLRKFKGWLMDNGGKKEMLRWSWSSKRGVARLLVELRDEEYPSGSTPRYPVIYLFSLNFGFTALRLFYTLIHENR